MKKTVQDLYNEIYKILLKEILKDIKGKKLIHIQKDLEL